MTGYTVTVSGPDGSREIELTEEQVKFFEGGNAANDLYSAALWLAYCHAWTESIGSGE